MHPCPLTVILLPQIPDVFTFEELLQSAPRSFSESDILESLNASGKVSLVQGCWVRNKDDSKG